jgi:hypothetical protein
MAALERLPKERSPMPESLRPHTTPPELAKDILTKLDNARAALSRSRAVAQRAGFQETDTLLARLEADLERGVDEVEASVRADVRRLLTGRE